MKQASSRHHGHSLYTLGRAFRERHFLAPCMSAALLASLAVLTGCSAPDRNHQKPARFETVQDSDSLQQAGADSKATRPDLGNIGRQPKPKAPVAPANTSTEEAPPDAPILPKLEDVFRHALSRALASAAERGDTKTLKKLFAEGADVDEQGIDGASVLMWAIINDSFDGAKALLDAGADPNLEDDLGNSPLILAATREDARFVEALLARGANVAVKDSRSTTPLMIASLLGRTQTVRFLILAKADVNATDASGRGALHYALLNPTPDVIRLLVEAGAKADSKDNAGLTPAELAPIGSSEEVKKLLTQGE